MAANTIEKITGEILTTGSDVTADGRYRIVASSRVENLVTSGNSSSADVFVTRYDTVTGTETEYRTTVFNRGPFYDVKVLNDGTVLLSGGSLPQNGGGGEGEFPLTRLNLATGTFTTLATPVPALSSIVSSADGNLLVTVGGAFGDATIATLDAKGQVLAIRETKGQAEAGFIGSVAVSAVTNSVVVGASNGLFLYDSQLNLKRDLQPELAAKLGVSKLTDVTFSADGSKLYVAAPEANAVFEIKTADWTVVRGFALGIDLYENGLVDGLVLSPDGQYLAVRSLFDAVRVDLATNNQIDGTPGSDTFAGTAFPDLIYGGAGNDRFEASGGADTLFGGLGDDTYLVNDKLDIVLERAGEGTDTVVTTVDYTLPANVEALHLAGGAIATLTAGPAGGTLIGNEFGTLLVGGDGLDVLNGEKGDDILRGGTGDTAEFADSIANARFAFVAGLPFAGENLVVTSADGRDVIEGIRVDLANPTQHTGITTLRFTDATISVSNLLATRLALTSAFDRTPNSDELSRYAKLVATLPTVDVAAAIRANPDVATAIDQRVAALYIQYEGRLPTDAERTAAHDRFVVDQSYNGIRSALNDGAPTDPEPASRFFLSPNFDGVIGGSASVYGSSEGERVAIGSLPGLVRFDPSFNRGGDTILFSGDREAWSVSLSGSNVVLTRGATGAIIPVGEAATNLVFADQTIALAFKTGQAFLGDQLVFETPAPITGTQTPPIADDAPLVPADAARLFLTAGADALVGSYNQPTTVFGTAEADQLTIVGGTVLLDPSFNRGGDTITIEDRPGRNEVTLVSSGSTVIIRNDGDQANPELAVSVPIGEAGITVELGGEAYKLALSPQGMVLFGDQVVGAAPVTFPFG